MILTSTSHRWCLHYPSPLTVDFFSWHWISIKIENLTAKCLQSQPLIHGKMFCTLIVMTVTQNLKKTVGQQTHRADRTDSKNDLLLPRDLSDHHIQPRKFIKCPGLLHVISLFWQDFPFLRADNAFVPTAVRCLFYKPYSLRRPLMQPVHYVNKFG